ncbi:hypothetical protein HDU87_001406 [Geranomyces variabilis]|uniref:holo-[acyl-carrier-protein] synthase n=1 Tax=Geranomyces variabilis TaxID=109894 RepID=A0AAD5TN81_9FUNG|nr:hypothetical protein HDU87_001406 [Geranomyces variabilis]
MLLWAFNVAAWEPSQETYTALTALLPADEASRIVRYHFPIDARRSLVGQLMARAAVCKAAANGTAWPDVVLQRTQWGKPELISPNIPNLLFNVSHHGSWAVLACSAHATMLGVDVGHVDSAVLSDPDFYSAFDHCFTPAEWRWIRSNPASQLARFYRLWTLKEAYVKAVGVGLGLDLMRVEFEVKGDDDEDIVVNVDGKWREEVRMGTTVLKADHPTSLCFVPSDKQGESEGGHGKLDFQVLAWEDLRMLLRDARVAI